MKTILKTKGLTCPNCSLKIENKLKALNKYEDVSVDPILERIVLTTKEDCLNQLDYEQIRKIMRKIEKASDIILESDKETPKKTFHLNFNLVLLVLGILILILNILLFGYEEFKINGLLRVKPSLWVIIISWVASFLLLSYKIIISAFRGLLSKDFFNENTLMLLASVGGLVIGEYLEAIMVMVLYQVGEALTDRVVVKSKQNVLDILDLRPKNATVVIDNELKVIEAKDIKVGDVVLIKVGETIACDGTIIEGKSFINSFSLDGEAAPKEVSKGSSVFTGCTNIGGVIKVEVNKEYTDTLAAKIVEYIENNDNKAKSEKFITKFARVYTKIVVILALVVAFVVPLIISLVSKESYKELLVGESGYLHIGLIFLVVSCPCALVLSVPLSFFIGIGVASKNRILIRSSADVEQLTSIKHFVFDKTGTLTKGSLIISKISNQSNYSDQDFIYYLAVAEHYSMHPIAKIINKMNNIKIEESNYQDYKEIESKGVTCTYEQKKLLVGNAKLLKDENLVISNSNKNTIYLYIDGISQGFIEYQDEVKEHSKLTVNELLASNKKVSMVTGDNEESAHLVASQIGISDVYTNCLPLDKVGVISKIKSKDNLVLFMGDGINDAPVLINANLGVSMGQAGSDLAIESSDIIIMNDDPHKIIDAISIAKRTKTIVIENILLAIIVKVVVMALSFIPNIIVPMWLAVFADVGISILCVFNSLRIMFFKSKIK
jgi:Cd2+/Zn2+-exporting ATPase